MGTSEVTVIRQGSNRILVQVPGLQDPEGAKNAARPGSKLEFKLVDLTADQRPRSRRVAHHRAARYSPIPRAIRAAQTDNRGAASCDGVQGDELIDAQPGNDQQSNAAIVNIRFDGQGGRKFAGRATQENKDRQAVRAMILDGVVLSAPNINEPILGGQNSDFGQFHDRKCDATGDFAALGQIAGGAESCWRDARSAPTSARIQSTRVCLPGLSQRSR